MCGDRREAGRAGDEQEPEPGLDPGLAWAAAAGTESWGEGCARDARGMVSSSDLPLCLHPRC